MEAKCTAKKVAAEVRKEAKATEKKKAKVEAKKKKKGGVQDGGGHSSREPKTMTQGGQSRRR